MTDKLHKHRGKKSKLEPYVSEILQWRKEGLSYQEVSEELIKFGIFIKECSIYYFITKHYGKIGNQRTGSGYIDSGGYRIIEKDGVAKSEHRRVMENFIGRELFPEENIHHLNGDKLDNRIENLEIWNTSQPSGQRIKDKLIHSIELLLKYKNKISNNLLQFEKELSNINLSKLEGFVSNCSNFDLSEKLEQMIDDNLKNKIYKYSNEIKQWRTNGLTYPQIVIEFENLGIKISYSYLEHLSRGIISEKKCKIENCNEVIFGKGYCFNHSNSIMLYNDPFKLQPKTKNRNGIIDKRGYKILNINKKKIFEHRLIMEVILNRPLESHENVHHKNGNRADNRPENLELWTECQPKGQRIEDKLKYSIEILELYGRTFNFYSKECLETLQIELKIFDERNK